jgi:phosphoserine phosphatase
MGRPTGDAAPRPRGAAFFDLDKTVIARSSTLVMGRTFMRDGLLSPATVVKSLYAQVVYQLVGADHDKMEQMRHAVIELTRGWEAERVRRLVRETVESGASSATLVDSRSGGRGSDAPEWASQRRMAFCPRW